MITIYEDEYLNVQFQEGNEQFPYFIHVTVTEWSRKIYMHTIVVWQAMQAKMLEMGLGVIYAGIPADDLKNKRFAELFGFEVTEYIEHKSDRDVDVEIWSMNLEEEL